MKGLISRFKAGWEQLHREIYVGEMRSQNMRACFFVGIAVAIVASTTTTMNFISNRDYITILTTIIQAISGIVIVIFILKDNKKIPTIMMILICVVTFTYYALSGATGGTTIIWTMLAPLGIGYFGNALYGIYCGVYFEALLIILFYTPIRSQMSDKYSKFFMDRFPVLYLLNLALISICIINYHLSVLKLQETAEELRQSKEEADRANRGKSDFLSSMSHEIRTPINAVLGMNEMILRESLSASGHPPKDKEESKRIFSEICNYSGNIESAGNNLLYIINDILDFSKIESGKMQISETDYKLSSVLNDVSNMISYRTRDKGLEFDVDVDKEIPDGLRGDEVRVRQIITNILGNAVKYTKQGAVSLRVRGESGSSDSLNLLVSVSDTGIGIKKEDIDKLFSKFERVDLERNSTVEGTGLGLAITKNLLDMMGGSIEVESEYGVGSTFTVRLPQKVVSDEPVGDFRQKFEESIREMDEYEESFHAPDAHILIVDDTRMNLLVVEGLLKNTGIKIDTAQSGETAIAKARQTRYDVILMDQRMPGMDGTEAMLHIKEEKGVNTETPFICLTADAISGAKERYLEAGFTDYLTKPIDYKALEKMLINYLPKDKVSFEKIETQAGQDSDEDIRKTVHESDMELLREAGIDTEAGLRFCTGDEELYDSILEDYADTFDEKTEKMNGYYAERDWKNYEILVHALKSTSKTIGAMELSGKAYKLEMAAKNGDADIIIAEHTSMMKQYEETAAVIKKVYSNVVRDEEEEIMEFAPVGE